MVDKKISELEQAQAVSPDDLLAIVQNVNGTLKTCQITVGQLLSSLGVSNTAARLVINDANVSQYFTHHGGNNPDDVDAYIPEGYSIIVVETTNRHKIAKIKPLGGVDFEDYKKITFMGNVDFWQGSGSGNYGISQYWYTYRHGGGNNFLVEAFTEFILKNKIWYSVYY